MAKSFRYEGNRDATDLTATVIVPDGTAVAKGEVVELSQEDADTLNERFVFDEATKTEVKQAKEGGPAGPAAAEAAKTNP